MTPVNPEQQVQHATDLAVGGAAVSVALTSPVWVEWLNFVAQEILLLGGAALILYRGGAIIWGCWRKK